jgi:hypothetical protein
METFNEWLKVRDPKLCESLVGRAFRHITSDRETGEMPEDQLTMHRLGNELDATDLSGMNRDQEFATFKKVWQDFHPGRRIPKDEFRGLFQKMFVKTQVKAKAFIDKLIADKQDNQGLFCGFLNWLQEDSISVDPVWKKMDCNGWLIEINLETSL